MSIHDRLSLKRIMPEKRKVTTAKITAKIEFINPVSTKTLRMEFLKHIILG